LRQTFGEGAVLYAANVTDVDDKINRKAAEEGVSIDVITDRYLAAYNADMAELGALRPTFQPRATRTMDAIIALIGRLVDNGSAYAAEGHVLLWKPSKPGEPVWDSPFGPGRPGWHVECTAMIEQSLGLPIDIHGGGIDLLFPHHENERAQGVCAHGHGPDNDRTYARYWMHNGFLNFGEEKMSKSLGNVALVNDLVKSAPSEALRWALLVGHYRAPLEWTGELIAQSVKALDRLYGALRRSASVEAADTGPDPAFLAALEDDLNTPAAMAELFGLATALETATGPGRPVAKGRLLASARLMGFLFGDPESWFQGDDAFRSQVDSLVASRAEARANRDWPAADRIRDELAALNVEVMDNASGATWRLKERT
jgi:cysteinyl-tRNA synthetase